MGSTSSLISETIEGPGGRIPALDGLRGIAILSVVVFHYFVIQLPLTYGLHLIVLVLGRSLWSGVDLFFVLSGFLIGGILLDARDSASYYGTFYIRRACRILPLYVAVCVLVVLGLHLPVQNLPEFQRIFSEPVPWPYFATFTQNFWLAVQNLSSARMLDPTWSLAVEEQFYLTLPLIIRYAKRQHLPFIVLSIIIFAICFRTSLALGFPGNNVAPQYLMPCRADVLMFGVLAAIAVRSPETFALLKKNNKRLVKAAKYLLLGVGILNNLQIVKHWAVDLVMASIGYTWFGLFYLAILLLAICGLNPRLNALLRFRPLMGLGIIAYGVYLFHDPVNRVCHWLVRGKEPHLGDVYDVCISVFALALTVAIARLSWVYLERPIVKLGHKFKYGEAPQPRNHNSEVAMAS